MSSLSWRRWRRWIGVALLLAAGTVGLWYLNEDLTRRGYGSFDLAHADDVAHAALIDVADLPGNGWRVTAVDRYDPSPPRHAGSACTEFRAREREIEGKYQPLTAARAKAEFWRASGGPQAVDTTIEAEITLFASADTARELVRTWRDFAGAASTSQCLAEDTGTQVVVGEPVTSVPGGGFAAAYRVVLPAAAQATDLRNERYGWSYRSAYVSVSILGSADAVDAALVSAVVAKAAEALPRPAAQGIERDGTRPGSTRTYVPRLDTAVAQVQEQIVALDAARAAGDQAAAATPRDLAPVRASVDRALGALRALAVPAEAERLQASAVEWGSALSTAAGGAWESRPAAPRLPQLEVGDAARQVILEATLARFATAAGAVPMIAARRDPAARVVLSRMSVNRALVEAIGPETTCARAGCVRDALPAMRRLEAAAPAVLARQVAASADGWTKPWSEAALAIRPGGMPLGGAGLAVGTPDAAPISPMVKQFADTCREGGGLVDDTGGVRELPTTEGGWTCWSKDRACWHFLTQTGALFTFGGSGRGCPQIAAFAARAGALMLAPAGQARVADPPPPAPAAPAAPAAPPGGAAAPAPVAPAAQPPPAAPSPVPAAPWDGLYRITLGALTCTPGTDSAMLETLRDRDSLQVFKGKAFLPPYGADIGADGMATGSASSELPTPDRVRIFLRSSAQFTFRFVAAAGGVTMTGTFTDTNDWDNGQTKWRDSCTRQFTAVRVPS